MRKKGVLRCFFGEKVLKTSVFLVVALLCISVYFLGQNIISAQQNDVVYDYVIVIDAGHGGIDGGVVGKNTGVKESDINLEIAKLAKKVFVDSGFKVILTRENEDGLYGSATEGFKKRDMKKRQEIIQNAKANLVLSVHCNKFASPLRSGPQVFFGKNTEGQKLALKLQKVLNDFTKNSHSPLEGDYFMLKCTTSPSVIVECGFLSNPDDEAKLCDPNYRQQLAETIFKGVMLYLSAGGMSEA